MIVYSIADSQQRMICELGAYVQRYDSIHLIAGYLLQRFHVYFNTLLSHFRYIYGRSLAERLVPEDYVEQVRAFQNAGQCDEYKCGQSSIITSPEVKPEANSSKDVESL